MYPLRVIVIFTEGEANGAFYKKLTDFISNSNSRITKIVVKTLNGFSCIEKIAPLRLQEEVLKNYQDSEVIVFCAYDLSTPAGALVKHPLTDWKKVEDGFITLGIKKVFHIKANDTIEDWFLADLDGLCSFLDVKKTTKLNGVNGYENIKILFKEGNRLYQKGYNTNKFVDSLDINKIYKKNKACFEELVNQIKEK